MPFSHRSKYNKTIWFTCPMCPCFFISWVVFLFLSSSLRRAGYFSGRWLFYFFNCHLCKWFLGDREDFRLSQGFPIVIFLFGFKGILCQYFHIISGFDCVITSEFFHVNGFNMVVNKGFFLLSCCRVKISYHNG